MPKPTNTGFYSLTRLAISLLLIIVCLFACNREDNSQQTAVRQKDTGPKVLDKRLELSLFAENPDIVTPIGIAVDSLNRLFVLESHTHLPPKGYSGPEGDRIKLFTDTNEDGKPDKITVFAEGLTEGLNIAFSPEGHLYVVTSRAVWILYDRNGDGMSEQRVKVVELTEPEKVYAHAALLGITFSYDGWMYISRGNTGSAAWKMQGTDASVLSGYGDGGNIVRARPDGTNLEAVATGFWNPMDLKFDSYGHLLAADNDPDSRGPNRLVHVVPGGDYGYQSRYGGSGIHPYLAWNGELPGTLPYAVGLGEAPSGLLDAGMAALPADYQGQMLCSIWEESRIVRIALAPKGVSVQGTTEVIVEGDQQFRPVAFATDRNGTIYFTDWVLRDYPNHGKGRIWKLAARKGEATAKPRGEYTKPLTNQHEKAVESMYASGPVQSGEDLIGLLLSEDPFLQHAAVTKLTHPEYNMLVLEATRHPNHAVRMGAMLALQKSGYLQAEPLVQQMLADPDVQIRQRALIWAGQGGMFGLKPYINRALSDGETTPELFETYLETVVHLMPEYIQAYHTRSEPYAKSIKRGLPPEFIESFIKDKSRSAGLRALAVRHLEKPGEHTDLLLSMLNKEKEDDLRLEVLRSLATIPGEDVARQLLKVATESKNRATVRAWAVLALTRQPVDMSAGVLPLLQDPSLDVQIEAARYLRTRVAGEGIKEAFRQSYDSLDKVKQEPLREQIALALSAANTASTLSKRPASPEEWQQALAKGGEPARGLRVLYAVQSMCSMCHKINGAGGELGPDLTNSGQSKTRTQLIQSILQPSEKISPEYQGWYVRLKNGEEYQGKQIDIGGGSIELFTQARGFVTFDKKEVEDYGMSEKSLMPDGLESQLTVSDLRDILAFLESKKEKSPKVKAVAQIKN